MKQLLLLTFILSSFFAKAGVPILNSMPTSNATIYLDFDGEYVNSGLWNNGDPFTCANPNLSDALINDVFNRVSEDYKLFNINITTDSLKYLASPLTQRIKVVITTTNFFAPNTSGIAYVGTFSWGDDTPAFAFISVNSYAKSIAETISHESGHTLGLYHQSVYDANCVKTVEYNIGQGDGEIGWAPIMGNPLNKTFTTWNNGKRSLNCVNQDDIAVIASKIQSGGLKNDDIANVITNAPNVSINGINVSASGLVNNETDVDVFKLIVTENSKLVLKIKPPVEQGTTSYGNIDLLVKLLDKNGVLIKSYNYADSLSAKIDTTLNTETYYISVDGTINVNTASDYGSVGSYSLFGTLQSIASLPIYNVDLRGTINNGKHNLSWTVIADELIAKTQIETSKDGINFTTIMEATTALQNFTYSPTNNNISFYRLKLYTKSGTAKYSNIIALQTNKTNAAISIVSNVVSNEIVATVQENVAYAIYDANGRILVKGTLINNLANKIDVSNITAGVYFMKGYTKNEVWTRKIFKN
jgi:Secretion system C-terminal sorting domain/Metallo-peptidase family M12B Reprolysin-like